MDLLIGKVDYLNCYPIYYPLEQGLIPLPAQIIKGPPALLNKKYLEGKLAITPISSIEYAQNPSDSFILPDLSISALGKVESIILFSKIPIENLNQKEVILTNSSATSIVLLKILLKYLYQVEPNYKVMKPDLMQMMEAGEAALLIGDDALNWNWDKSGYYSYDLGELWYQFTGLPMVYAVWVIRKEVVRENYQLAGLIKEGFNVAKQWQADNNQLLIQQAAASYTYPAKLIENYFATIKYDLDQLYINGLTKYFAYAKELGVVSKKIELEFWR